MTYLGKVRNGVVVLNESSPLPEGSEVRVELVRQPEESNGSLEEALADLAGSIDDLPGDFARNHDHYLHGGPRR